MTFLESESITIAADRACNIARDKFFEAFMPYSDAGLSDEPDRVCTPSEVNLNMDYGAAMYAFYLALKSKYEAQAVWIVAMETGHYQDPILN